MGSLNNCFFPYSKSKKAVISLVFAHKGSFNKHSFSNYPYVMNILFERKSAKGIYHIGRIGDDILWDQYGMLDLVWDTDGRNVDDPPVSGKTE